MRPTDAQIRRRRRGAATALAIAAVSVVAVEAASSAAPSLPPPWSQCAHADHPPAADLGPLLSPMVAPPLEVRAVLLGQVEVGTDCSIYDSPL